MPIRPEDRGRYPADWELRSRFVRFVRARGRCEWCGAAHGKPHPETGSIVVLTTAHVYDDRPEASSLLNLAALCQKCHNKHDAPGRRARRMRARRFALVLALPFEVLHVDRAPTPAQSPDPTRARAPVKLYPDPARLPA